MTADTAWHIENLLTGRYVDSTSIDHPGRVETDDYRFQVTDIEVDEPDHPLYRLGRRFGAAPRYQVETTVVFDDAPDPDAVQDHQYRNWVGGNMDFDDDTLTLAVTVQDRRRYDQRFAYFTDIIDDVLGADAEQA